jgi:hypothetical protein
MSMPNAFLNPTSPPEDVVQRRRRVRLSMALTVFGLLLILLAVFRSHRDSTAPAANSAAESQAALGPEERAYTANVGVDRLEVSRAENFLHQEVTTVSGQITNGGNRALASVELTIQFSDDQNQIAQRETRTLFGPPGPPIPPGDNREFEISFEHISSSWNMRQPAVKVTALQFFRQK